MKPIAFKGTDTIATLLANFGKIKTNGTNTFTLTFSKVESKFQIVATPCIPNKAEKDAAIANLSKEEQVEFLRLIGKVDHFAKSCASNRVAGQTSERWTTTGEASLVKEKRGLTEFQENTLDRLDVDI